MRRVLIGLSLVVGLVGAVFPSGAAAKSVGGCPSGDGWQLVTVESLGITPEQASGIPSLDGKQDGWTCISPSRINSAAPVFGADVFRDNTVASTG